MIIAETPNEFRFVTQPDHADLAGAFADRWGNDRFERPTPTASMAIAAYHHDTGWEAYDRRPHLHDDGRPVDFREMPPATWIPLYDAGIDAVVELDAYAGLLVSMHGAGLRNQRYGLSPSWPETPSEYRGFVEEQEALQARLAGGLREAGRLSAADEALLSALHESGSGDGNESRLWRNYALLQAWDTLSLAFCLSAEPPGIEDISQVPVADGAETTLSIRRVENGFTLEPYPFDTAPLAVSVPVRTVEKGSFDGEAELLRAYYRDGCERVDIELRPEG